MIAGSYERTIRSAVGRARAYCGPAHGQWWELDVENPLPAQVALPVGAKSMNYWLVHDPRRNGPARDHQGNYLYMPLRNTQREDYAA